MEIKLLKLVNSKTIKLAEYIYSYLKESDWEFRMDFSSQPQTEVRMNRFCICDLVHCFQDVVK